MPLSPYTEPKLLDQLLGSCVAQCNTTAASQSGTSSTTTTLTLRGSSGAGSADITPAANDYWLFVTPGTGATQNQYTNPQIFLATGGTATSITFAAVTLTVARAIGDYAFRLGTTTTFTNWMFLNTVYVGLSTIGAQTTIAAGSDGIAVPGGGTINVASTTGFPTQSGTMLVDTTAGLQTVTYTGTTGTSFTGCAGGTGTMKTSDVVLSMPTSATILSSEPTSAGAYARVAAVNNPANFSAATGSLPATKVNLAALTFPASTAAWSTGATVLDLFFIADVPGIGTGNVLAWGYLTTAQAVNASGITPSFAGGALSATLL